MARTLEQWYAAVAVACAYDHALGALCPPAAQGTIMKRLDGRADEPSADGAPEWWADFYSVMGWVLGQDLPQSNEVGLPSQVMDIWV